MNDLMREVTRCYNALPRLYQLVFTIFIALIAANEALEFGRSVGRALYLLSQS